MNVFLIDAIGPFFVHVPHHRHNWSKVPFQWLEVDGTLPRARADEIVDAFARFCATAASIGFNAISVDDVAHLIIDERYPVALQTKLAAYRNLYERLFRIAAERGLAVYLTSDLMYSNATLAAVFDEGVGAVADYLSRHLPALFAEWPMVRGIIFRFGECDGAHVGGDFQSRLLLRTPRQAVRFLRRLLPMFEQAERDLVFRTWSVGAYPIGDLMWNRRTFHRVFDAITSPRLVISMKYGESDFFRYLPLNKLFFATSHRTWIEFQARREYEGFGEYPSFVGRDYHRYLLDLRRARNVEGCTIWCQTGGWSIFRRLTFLANSSIWNEINTCVTVRLCRTGCSVEQAVADFVRWKWGSDEAKRLMELLDLSDEVVKELLYIPEFASRKLFFRRLRVPPLLSVFWDQVLVNHSMRKILRCFVSDGERALREARDALGKIRRMEELAAELSLPVEDLRFQYDTFELLALAREYYLRPFTPSMVDRLQGAKQAYKARHRDRYSFHLDFERVRVKGVFLRAVLRLLLRRQRGYRMVVDRVLVIHVLSRIYPAARRLHRAWIPSFAHERAMGIDTIFK